MYKKADEWWWWVFLFLHFILILLTGVIFSGERQGQSSTRSGMYALYLLMCWKISHVVIKIYMHGLSYQWCYYFQNSLMRTYQIKTVGYGNHLRWLLTFSMWVSTVQYSNGKATAWGKLTREWCRAGWIVFLLPLQLGHLQKIWFCTCDRLTFFFGNSFPFDQAKIPHFILIISEQVLLKLCT